MTHTLHKVEPEEPWWDRAGRTSEDYWELREHATDLYEALVALRAESQWEQTGLMTRFKTRAEVAADKILDRVVKSA